MANEEVIMSALFSERVLAGVALLLTVLGSLVYYSERTASLEERVDLLMYSTREKDTALTVTLKELNTSIGSLNVTMARFEERLNGIEKK